MNNKKGRLSAEGEMYKFVVLFIAVSASIAQAGGLVGRPAFCVGSDVVAMTLEFSNMHYAVDAVSSDGGDRKDKVDTQRGLLRTTFGITPGIDADIALGTANLSFPEGPEGYSTFRSDWAFAWGGGVRFGYPSGEELWQLQLSVSYIGFKAEGETVSEQKAITSYYTWQEFSPTLTAGYRFGKFTPYIGVMQTILFGTRDTRVEFLGTERPGAGGKENYTDGKQSPQGLLGVDWLLPDGYYLTAQVSTSGKNEWGFSLGLAQALR